METDAWSSVRSRRKNTNTGRMLEVLTLNKLVLSNGSIFGTLAPLFAEGQVFCKFNILKIVFERLVLLEFWGTVPSCPG